MRAGSARAGAGALVLALAVVPAAPAAARVAPAPLHRAARTGHYIVVLKARLPVQPTRRSERRARAADERVAASVGATPVFDYVADLEGFAARLTRSQVRRLRHHPRVRYVERDAHVEEDTTQSNAPWDLDRIDQREQELDTTYTSTS